MTNSIKPDYQIDLAYSMICVVPYVGSWFPAPKENHICGQGIRVQFTMVHMNPSPLDREKDSANGALPALASHHLKGSDVSGSISKTLTRTNQGLQNELLGLLESFITAKAATTREHSRREKRR